MISIPMNQAQFDAAKKAVETNDQVISKNETSDKTGTFATSQVELEYNYTNGIMEINVLAKHGLAKFASESTIQNHLVDLLKEVV